MEGRCGAGVLPGVTGRDLQRGGRATFPRRTWEGSVRPKTSPGLPKFDFCDMAFDVLIDATKVQKIEEIAKEKRKYFGVNPDKAA